jgi:hypothetical protein
VPLTGRGGSNPPSDTRLPDVRYDSLINLKRAVRVIEIAPLGGSANGSGLGVPPRRPGARASSNHAAVTDDRQAPSVPTSAPVCGDDGARSQARGAVALRRAWRWTNRKTYSTTTWRHERILDWRRRGRGRGRVPMSVTRRSRRRPSNVTMAGRTLGRRGVPNARPSAWRCTPSRLRQTVGRVRDGQSAEQRIRHRTTNHGYRRSFTVLSTN